MPAIFVFDGNRMVVVKATLEDMLAAIDRQHALIKAYPGISMRRLQSSKLRGKHSNNTPIAVLRVVPAGVAGFARVKPSRTPKALSLHGPDPCGDIVGSTSIVCF